MLKEVSAAATALDGFVAFISTYWTDQAFNAVLGNPWNVPSLTRQDLALRTRRIADRLKALPDEKVDSNLKQQLVGVPGQIQFLQNSTIPQIQGGNAPIVLLNYELVISNIESALPVEVVPDWEQIHKADLIPRNLGRKLRLIEASIKQLEPRTDDLNDQITAINNAHAAALDLPTDLESLKEAREVTGKLVQEARECLDAILQARKEAEAGLVRVQESDQSATGLIANIGKAYSAATSAGLAGAFTERASKLNGSTWAWVVLLVVSLIAGGWLGHDRLVALQGDG